MAIGVFQKGILKTVPHLNVFLEDEIVFNPKASQGLKAIAGWGFKETSKKAIIKAKEWSLPYFALEDGFIRSIGFGFEEPPLSLIVDPVGIYYDATRHSHLENILNSTGWEAPELIEQAKHLRSLIIKHNISKYNNYKSMPENYFTEVPGKDKILVIDQTLNDMSVTLGMADRHTFKEMFEACLDENPNAMIFIKMHPDVIKGKKKGYLTNIKQYSNVRVIRENYNPVQIIKEMDKVYTVTSQMGFEALMAGKPVVCFGMPFYAGWGLTEDKMKCARRAKRRNIDELVLASYILYPRYINPENKSKGTVFDVIDYLPIMSKVL